MAEEKPPIAPLAMNREPADPQMQTICKHLDTMADLHGYAMVTLVFRVGGKMGLHGAGLEKFGGEPGQQFERDAPGFFRTLATVLAVAEELQRRENKAAGKA
jgi:hypothetical protein